MEEIVSDIVSGVIGVVALITLAYIFTRGD